MLDVLRTTVPRYLPGEGCRRYERRSAPEPVRRYEHYTIRVLGRPRKIEPDTVLLHELRTLSHACGFCNR
jgi:hypothetical protein